VSIYYIRKLITSDKVEVVVWSGACVYLCVHCAMIVQKLLDKFGWNF